MKTETPIEWLDWPAPSNVKACFTVRGVSPGKDQPGSHPDPDPAFDYEHFNLAMHVGDQETRVAANRQRLQQALGQGSIHWLQQIHGTGVWQAAGDAKLPPKADAAFTRESDQVCVVMTADCLPVFFCDQQGSTIAVAHAGWRGLAAGIVLKTLEVFPEPTQVMAYLGPAISQTHFEVGDDVRRAFLSLGEQNSRYFEAGKAPGKWQADLYGLARAQLLQAGVHGVYGGDRCTFAETDHFYSYRRSKASGRMASLIWLEKD